MKSDSELLQYFARTNSEDAFAELVKRHVNLIYSAALRQVGGDEHLAKDVTQSVFTDLARKAKSLARRQNLTGWFYTSAHFAAAKIIRTETRRRDREEKFMRAPKIEPAPDTEWENLRPMLDDAMHELKQADREAILLRYFENRSFVEVGAKLGLNENSARMRVDRAVEKLRTIFAKRGVATTSALAAAISANAVQFAPAGLTATLPAMAIASAGGGTFSFLQLMTTAKLKLGLATLLLAGGATAIVLQHQGQQRLSEENETLLGNIIQIRADNQSLSNRLLSINQPKLDDNFNELLKLRGEVGVLRRQVEAATEKAKDSEQKLTEALSAQAKFKTQEITTVNNMKQLGLAELIFANDGNNGQFATNFEQITNELGPLYTNGGLDGIELVNLNLPGITNVYVQYPRMIVSREIMSRQSPDGTWHRVYGLADGSIHTATSYDGNFDAWEKANTTPPPQNPNQ